MSLHFDVSNFNFNSQVLNSNHRRSLCELFTMAGLHLEPTSLGCCQVSGRGEIYGRNGWEQEEKVGFPLGNPKVPDFRGCLSHIFSPLRQFATSERRIHGTLILWRWIALFCHFSFLLNFPFLTWRTKKTQSLRWNLSNHMIWKNVHFRLQNFKLSTFGLEKNICRQDFQCLLWNKTCFVSGGVCLWWWSLGCLPIRQLRATLSGVDPWRVHLWILQCFLQMLQAWQTVDGRNPAPPGIYKPYKSWDKLHINWLAGFLPSKVTSSYTFQGVKEFAQFHWDAAWPGVCTAHWWVSAARTCWGT